MPDPTNNSHNYGILQRIPYYPVGKRLDLNNAPNAVCNPPFNSQTSEPGKENSYSYQQNGACRIRPRLISRTPSNPAPSPANHHASRNYGFYSPSPRDLLHQKSDNNQQPMTSSPYRNGNATSPIYGGYKPVSASNINYQRLGNF
uniref:Uncharacterized protein n=1 Tax=Romanomermis culicivorax TaxID=13658 RepID=A0A915KGM1_ROMCU